MTVEWHRSTVGLPDVGDVVPGDSTSTDHQARERREQRTGQPRPSHSSQYAASVQSRPMSDYTIKNLVDDVDDAAAKRGTDGMHAHFGRDAIESEHLGITLFRFEPGYRVPFGHRHREQEEGYVVVAGSGRVCLDGEVRDLRQWDVVRTAPAIVRAFEAGPDGMDLVAIGNDRPEGGDGEMVPDVWSD